MTRLRIGIGILILAALLPAALASGQASTGNIYGKAVDEQGGALPGVSVTLTGPGAPQTTFTDARGDFRYLNLSVGSYSLTLTLQGFSTVTRDGVVVNLGQNTDLTVPLKLSSVTATVTVSGETPVIDSRKTNTGANFQLQELKSIPTGRDPWVILQQVPGVQMDRLNIAGNQSGQQSAYIGMGTDTTQNAFNMDGVTITDMAALGSSPTYYDFDQFQEIQVATGGADTRIQTPGVQLNMVYKRGTNDFRGSGRYFHTNGEESTVDAEAKPYLNFFNAIDAVDDYGLELGGPVIKDRLWLWGAYGRNQIDLFVAQPTCLALLPTPCSTTRFTDKTKLETINGKLNAQITTNNSAVLLYSDSGKTKFGRNASPTRPPETTFNQDKYGPKGNYKIEDTHIFS